MTTQNNELSSVFFQLPQTYNKLKFYFIKKTHQAFVHTKKITNFESCLFVNLCGK